MVVRNSLNKEEYKLLIESMGLSPIVSDLTDIVFQKYLKEKDNPYLIDNNKKTYVIVVDDKEYNKSFFNQLNVIINIVNEEDTVSKYLPKYSNWIEDTMIFDEIFIEIQVDYNSIDDIRELIAHELTHSFEDYNRKKKSNNSFGDVNYNYFSVFTPELNNIIEKFGKNDKLNKLVYFIYYLLEPEKKANVTQLYFELKKLKLNKEDIVNGNYKSLTFYKIYDNINKYSFGLLNSLNDNEIELLKEFVKESYFSNLYSESNDIFINRLYKFFKEKSERALNKMRKITYLYFDNLNENHKTSTIYKKIFNL
jgi:hypothetical protein